MPWHLGTSYLVNGDPQAKTACDKMNAWIRTKTGNNINNLQAGYKLDGTSIPNSNDVDLVFVAPLGVSACVNSTNQVWLNDIWIYLINQPVSSSDYFGNTLKMLCMLNITQNYFPPQNKIVVYLVHFHLILEVLFFPKVCSKSSKWGFKVLVSVGF